MSAVSQLSSEKYELERRLVDVTRRLHAAMKDAAEFRPGDVVDVVGYSGDRKRAVIRRAVIAYDKLTYEVSYERKNGGWMDRVSRLYGSQRCEVVQ